MEAKKVTEKEHEEMFDYFYEWLTIWNKKCLRNYLPTEWEFNFKQAEEVNDWLSQTVADDADKEVK